jgi:N-methylhydantoinase B
MPEECKLPAAAADVRLARGALFRICTPGAGGYGPAAERDAAAAERDALEDRVSGAGSGSSSRALRGRQT